MLPRRSDWWHVWLFNTFGNDTKGLGGRCGLRPSAPSSSLRQLATSSRCYPVHGLLPEKYSQWREKNTLLEKKISSGSRHNPGAEACQRGHINNPVCPVLTWAAWHASAGGLWHVTRHAGSGECYTVTAECVLCCKVPSGAEYHCAETGAELQEKRNTCFIYSESDTCPITSPFLSADISKCFSMLNNIPMYSLAVRVSGRRLLWFPSLATRSRSRSICLVLTLSKPGWIQVAELLSLSLSRLSVFTQ